MSQVETSFKVLSELRPSYRNTSLIVRKHQKKNPECWHVVFAPDETRFAWLCGNQKVILVPWNRFKNCLLDLDNLDDQGNEIKSELVVIDAGSPVNSVAFGTGTPEANFPAKGHWTRFDFSKDLTLATGHANGRVRIWDVYTGRLLLELMDHRDAIRDMSFAPDGSLRLVTASLDKSLKVWDLKDDGNMFRTLTGHKGHVLWCTWSPNSKYLASSGAEKNVLIWDMRRYRIHKVLEGHNHSVHACEFSPDGALIATASCDTRVILWDPVTGEQLRTLYHMLPPPRPIFAAGANGAWVRGIAYSRDGLHIATVSDGGIVRFWDLTDPECDSPIVHQEANEDDELLCCTISPSGRALAVGNRDSRVTFYQVPRVVSSLRHLARMAVRKHVESPQVDELNIPTLLKEYIKYHRWF